MATNAAKCGARTRREALNATRTQSNKPTPLQQGRAPRQNASFRRLQPLSGAAAVQRGEKRIQGGSRGTSQSPYPSLAAGGCHMAANAAKGGARTRRESPQRNENAEQQTYPFATRQSAAPERIVPPPPTPQRSGGVSRGKGESKEGLGGNRNPPGPPWPPEAATWLLTQPNAAQERAAKPSTQRERRATNLPLCNKAERRARTHRSAASNPSAERRRYKGVRRESKEGVGGTRNPPIPPWPPEAATRLLPQPTAAQERAAKPSTQRERRATNLPLCNKAERRARTLRSAASNPSAERRRFKG